MKPINKLLLIKLKISQKLIKIQKKSKNNKKQFQNNGKLNILHLPLQAIKRMMLKIKNNMN